MEKTIAKQEKLASFGIFVCLSLLGCGLLTLASLVKIPFYPVAFTLHTLVVSILGLTQSPKQAMGSVICYLLFATLGLPVLSGHANPLWILGKCGGYYAAFPFAAYLISKLSQKWHPLVALTCGQMFIYLLGFIWLVPFFGAKVAFISGVLFFIPSDMLKNLVALGITNGIAKWQTR